MTYQFLSSEWIAAVRVVRAKYAGETAPVSYKVRMNQVITDAPFGDGGVVKLFTDTTDGTVVMDFGQLDDAEVTVSTDYATARKLLVDLDLAAVMQAFLGGKVKITGDMMKLLQMQAVEPDDVTKLIATEIRRITA